MADGRDSRSSSYANPFSFLLTLRIYGVEPCLHAACLIFLPSHHTQFVNDYAFAVWQAQRCTNNPYFLLQGLAQG